MGVATPGSVAFLTLRPVNSQGLRNDQEKLKAENRKQKPFQLSTFCFCFQIALRRTLEHNFRMLAKVCSAALNGIEAYPVEVEVNAGWGDTIVVIVGLPDAAVKESRDRVSTALTNSGYKFPMGRTTINLAPADVKKEGPSFDLPIALGMLAASEQLETDQLDNFIIVGELALTGAVAPVGFLSFLQNSVDTRALSRFRLCQS